MIQVVKTRTCVDEMHSVQAEGKIYREGFSLDWFASLLHSADVKVFALGNPKVLVCKRSDFMILLNSDGSFNISGVSSEEDLYRIIAEFETKIISLDKECL